MLLHPHAFLWGSVGSCAPKLTTTSTLVVRRLNELYKASVVSCQGLSLRLQRFFLDKQRLLDGIHGVTAERLILSHAVQMVWAVCVLCLSRLGTLFLVCCQVPGL